MDDRQLTEATSVLRPLECTGLQPHFRHKLAAHGVVLPDDFYEPEHQLVGAGSNGNGNGNSSKRSWSS